MCAAIDTTTNHVLVSKWVAERFRQIASRTRLRHFRRVSDLVIPAAQQTGTWSITAGRDVVVPDAEALVAIGPDDVTGRYIRFGLPSGPTWYEVAQGPVGGPFRLTVPLPEATNAAASYTLVARRVALPPDVKWLSTGGMVLQRVWQPLMNLSQGELDYQAPARPWAGPWPMIWCESSPDPATGAKRIEFYPYSIAPELVSYVNWVAPPLLPMSAELPGWLDPSILVDGALIDAMRHNMSRALNAGNLELAGYWRNEYRAQAATWEDRMVDAIRGDRGVDDVTLVLQLRNAYGGLPRDIVTARDQVWATGPYH